MSTDASTPAIRHGAWLLAGAVLLVSAVAWGWTVMGAGMDMTALDMTRMAGMDGWLMQPAVWTLNYALLMFSMWWVMMIAMMLPSALPVLLVFAKAQGNAETRSEQSLLTSSFAAGYLLIWGAFSAMAAGLQWALETVRLLSPMLETANTWLGAAILIAAGLWQLTPIKAACHSPLPLAARFLAGSLARGTHGCDAHGTPARRVLSRLLLVPDAAFVLRRRDESLLDCGAHTLRIGREAAAGWTDARADYRCCADWVRTGARLVLTCGRTRLFREPGQP